MVLMMLGALVKTICLKFNFYSKISPVYSTFMETFKKPSIKFAVAEVLEYSTHRRLKAFTFFILGFRLLITMIKLKFHINNNKFL
jgi:hypothetical protein